MDRAVEIDGEPGSEPLRIYRGHLIHLRGAPTLETAADALESIPDGALAIDGSGRIAYSGEWNSLPGDALPADVIETSGIILPGFVDTHVHFPQTFVADSFSGQELLGWLDRCVFPIESRLCDAQYADHVALHFVRRRAAVGTTAALVFGSAFPVAQDALFSRTLAAGMRIVSGRGIQTTGTASASALITSEDDAIALSRDEIDRWHGTDVRPGVKPEHALGQVAVIPRFSLSVTPETLRRLGDLYGEARERGVYFHSHLSENNRPQGGELAAVRATFGVDDYLDTYDGRFLPGSCRGGESLLGRRSVFAHAVHCTDAELSRLAETNSSIAHCPTSQLFLGSGTMPWGRTCASGVTLGLGTDIGAGDEWLIPRVLNDAFKVHMSETGDQSTALHPAQLLFLGTLGGARALDQEPLFGNFDVGKEADFVIVDPTNQSTLPHSLAAAAETGAVAHLFTLLMGMREESIVSVHVRGQRVAAPRPHEAASPPSINCDARFRRAPQFPLKTAASRLHTRGKER